MSKSNRLDKEQEIKMLKDIIKHDDMEIRKLQSTIRDLVGKKFK